MATFSEHYGREVSPANLAVYMAGLRDLTEEGLERACALAIASCRFMPTIADIRAQVEIDRKLALAAACDAEWSDLLSKIDGWDEYYSAKSRRPVWGSAGAPQLSEAGKQAVKLCGGFTTIRQTKPEHRPHLKKQFAEFYGRQVELERRGVLTDGQARELLSEVKKRSTKLLQAG